MEDVEKLVLAYYDDIMRYFVCRIRDKTTAEDLTQETFLRWIRYAGEAAFAGEGKKRAYLYRIASNVCRDHFRTLPPLEPLEEDVPAPGEDGDLSLTLAWALGKLPDSQREAAMLYYYSGFKVREIAGIQGVTVSAVKSRLKLARDVLKKILSEQGGLV